MSSPMPGTAPMPTPIRAERMMAGNVADDGAELGQNPLDFLGFTDLEAIFEHLDDLGNAEGTDEHGHHLDAAVQFGEAEGEPRIELQQVTAHAGQEQPQKTGDPAL